MAEAGSGEGRETLIYENPRSRRTVVRMALMYTPMAIAAGIVGGIALLNLLNGAIGAIVGVLILGIIGAATGFQAVTALRDLGATPATTRGVVERLWDKGTVLWVSRTHYAMVRSTRPDDPARTIRQVFVVSGEAALALTEGSNVVVEHWPHTHTVVRLSTVERVTTAERAAAAASERRGTRRSRPTR